MRTGEINQRRLRYFVEVYRRGSIRAAADSLNTASSVLTRQMRLLEEELGFPLFERSPRGVLPTPAAQALIEYSRGCENERNIFESTLQELNGLETGSIKIAASEGFVHDLMTEVITPFTRSYPKISIRVEVRSVNDVVTDVADGEADIGAVYNPPLSKSVECIAWGLFPLRVVVPPGHPLAERKDPIEFAEATRYPLGIMSTAYGVGQAVEAVALSEHLTFEPSFVTNSSAALGLFVSSGAGIAFMGRWSAGDRIGKDGLIGLELKSALAQSTTAKILVREGRRQPRAVELILSIIKANVPAFKGSQ
ncbi:transcriptional regulator, LysR family [Burkholderia sp. GAS332]|nr:transcriptional regulator, LysR family [Burkholderia sp. GAS332]